MSQSNSPKSPTVTEPTSHIAYRANGEAQSFVGRDAVEVFRLATLISGLKLESKGMRVSRHVNCLKVAKQTTGLRTNDRQKHIDRLQVMLAEQKEKVAHVTDDPTPKPHVF